MTQAVGYRDNRITMKTDTFKLASGDKLRQCPYNKSHQILESSFKTHLEKCRRNYPMTVMGVCKFNAQHHIPEPELSFHHQTCPDIKAVVHDVVESSRNNPNPLESANRILACASESWDVDECTGYNPMAKIEKNPLLLHLPAGTTRSQRTEFHQRRKKQIEETPEKKSIPGMPETPITSDSGYPLQTCDTDDDLCLPLSAFVMDEPAAMPPLPRPAVAPTVNPNLDQPIGRGKGRKIAANIFGDRPGSQGKSEKKKGGR